MKFLLLIAHGSRRQGANDEIERLAKRVAGLGDNDYDGVVAAFLEIAEPDIHHGISRCVELGADHIVVVPYFLAGGNHVNKDIPGEIACARGRTCGARSARAGCAGTARGACAGTPGHRYQDCNCLV